MNYRALAVVLLVATAGCTVNVNVEGLGSTGGTAETRTATVVEIVDGDTIDVRFEDGNEERIRLLGVDTPEVYGNVNPGEYEGIPDTEAGQRCLDGWADNASQYATDQLAGKTVTVATDSIADRRGSYGRLLAYITVQGENESFNYALLEHGYARLYDSEFSRNGEFTQAELTAREQRTGLWACAS